MRGLVVPSLDGPAVVALRGDLAEPVGAHPWADSERLLVDVRAAAVSFPDLLQTRGRYQHGAPVPYVTGGEYAGVVLEAPPGARFRAGDRVAGFCVWGAVADRVLAIPRYTMHLPDTMSWTEGAAIFLNYATAWFTLERAAFRDGDAVLVHGAAGGVGTAVLDLLRGRAAPSLALVSTAAKAEVARACGADEVVLTDGAWVDHVRGATGRGVDVVIDPVGGDRFTDSLRVLDIGGRLMVVGFAAGEIPEVRVNRLLLRNLSVVGVALDPWQQRFAGHAPALVTALEEAAGSGRIRPHVGTVLPMSRAAEALPLLDRRESLGKVVVDLTS